MDTSITGRNATITDRFRAYAEEKVAKVEAFAPKAVSTDVRVSRHHDVHGNAGGDRVEITVRGPGPVVRAEAEGPDKYVAFDSAYHRLLERLRRLKERRTSLRGARRTSLHDAATGAFEQVALAPASVEALERVRTGQIDVVDEDVREDEEHGDRSPVLIREKVFPTKSMSVRDAVDQMELVGHDFYLFVDEASGRASVVYRRKGWSYGVISLDEVDEPVTGAEYS